MSRLGRLIQRRRQNRRLSATEPAVYQENGETAPGEKKNSEIPINDLLPVGTDTSLIEFTEIRDRLKQASLERGYTHTSQAAQVMPKDLSSYRAHEKGSRGLTVKSEMSYAEFFNFECAEFFNFEWSMTGNREDQHKLDGTSLDFSLVDEDFELVLRHFWKHLDAEKRRKLIQLAAGLLELDLKER